MSGGDYYHCPICGFKALYDPSDEVGRELQVLHQECFTKVNAALDAAAAVIKVWREWERGHGKVVIPVKALAVAVDVLALTPAAESLRDAFEAAEPSEHSLDDSYICTLCGVLDEDALRAELAQARSAIHIADATTGRRTAQRDQARAEAEKAHAAGFVRAVAMLRDDQRYVNWWTALPQQDPAYGYWQAPARRHLADYLETVGPGEAVPSTSESVRLPHAPCHETDEHQPHPWGDPAHWCDGSGKAGA